jgi:hypothetical protein
MKNYQHDADDARIACGFDVDNIDQYGDAIMAIIKTSFDGTGLSSSLVVEGMELEAMNNPAFLRYIIMRFVCLMQAEVHRLQMATLFAEDEEGIDVELGAN